jgi:hypothetical protein
MRLVLAVKVGLISHRRRGRTIGRLKSNLAFSFTFDVLRLFVYRLTSPLEQRGFALRVSLKLTSLSGPQLRLV